MTKRIDSKYHIEVTGFASGLTVGQPNLAISIVKTGNGQPIPDDEPVILVRAKDWLALPLLRYYREICLLDGCTDFHMRGLDAIIHAFEEFKEKHQEVMKQPGSTGGK